MGDAEVIPIEDVAPELKTAGSGGGAEMVFQNVCVDANGKRILWDVSGKALPGQMLALMGPSGSGKTTLLNALSGRMSLASGRVEIDSVPLSKRLKRKISYVQQTDVFFPNLTLRETLRYSALIRLPSTFSFRQKLNKVEEIITTLRLQDCANTCIGNVEVRGLSGGEIKRANIGCELLTSPSLLLLDEPTSGLDSTSALQLLDLLREQLAMRENKTIVMSIHQPSSQMYYMFENMALLAKGKVAYFGAVCEAMNYFSRVGLHCDLLYNPAEYMLDLVTDDSSLKILIGEDPQQDTRPKSLSKWQRAIQWFWSQFDIRSEDRRRRRGREDVESGRCEMTAPPLSGEEVGKGEGVGVGEGQGVKEEVEEREEKEGEEAEEIRRCLAADESPVAETKDDRESIDSTETVDTGKWPTSWWWQVAVLTVRNFRQSRHTIISKTNLFLTAALCIVCSLIWFQIPRTEESISDRTGFIYFTLTFWSFDIMFTALFAFPAERVVINRERSNGAYRLSAYYLAKTLSELPLILVRPSIFIIITYWTVGMNGIASFFGFWFFILHMSFLTQSLGLLIGATVTSASVALTLAVLTVISCMLVAGFFVEHLPHWLGWAKTISFVTYGYDALLRLEFTQDSRFSCSEGASSYASCNTTSLTGSSNETTAVSGPDILQELGGAYPLHVCFLAILVFALVFRTLTYLSLRFLHRP